MGCQDRFRGNVGPESVRHPSRAPTLRLWSTEVADELGIEIGQDEILGGNQIAKGMDSYAQRYGGHQFGNWAGQLGDGRAITLGEVDTGQGVLELQLKGSGSTPYSRFADGKAVLRSSIRESFSVAKQCTILAFQPPVHCHW